MKRAVVFIISILGVVVVMLWSLFISANLPNKLSNGFTRKWNEVPPHQIGSVTISQTIQKIAGISSDRIFLTGIDPRWTIELNKDLKYCDTIIFKLPTVRGNYLPNRIFIDSPDVYIHCNNMGTIWKGKLDTMTFQYQKMPLNVFTASAQLSHDKAIVRSFMKKGLNQTFRIWSHSDSSIIKEDKIFDEDETGAFHDGSMQFDAATNRIIYIERFSNLILCLDSNLNIIYKANTIDTIRHPKLEVSNIFEKKQSKIIPSNSRVMVNKDFYIFNKSIFVISSLRSDGEMIKDFNSYDVFDVYSLIDGKYINSFRIPRIDNADKIRSFAFDNEILFALYKNKLITYSLPLSLKKKISQITAPLTLNKNETY